MIHVTHLRVLCDQEYHDMPRILDLFGTSKDRIFIVTEVRKIF
jgi:hypothetical protein